jgi:hypothetical protein
MIFRAFLEKPEAFELKGESDERRIVRAAALSEKIGGRVVRWLGAIKELQMSSSLFKRRDVAMHVNFVPSLFLLLSCEICRIPIYIGAMSLSTPVQSRSNVIRSSCLLKCT